MSFGTPEYIYVTYGELVVQDMVELLLDSPFPNKAPIDTDTPWKLGIDHDYISMLKESFRFDIEWSWEELERKIVKFSNYMVHYEHEGDVLDLHYVHIKSRRGDGIPLILLHGWPGTFFDFYKVIEPLIDPPLPDLPSFDVVVPSLPGYFRSTLPRRDGWNLVDIARLFNGLMASVLGMFPDSCSLMHFNMFYVESPGFAVMPQSSDSQKKQAEDGESKFGYFAIQATKPFTIGLAIASSPLAMLTYIGEKIYGWSDPRLLDPGDHIMDTVTVALYYLSDCFATSVVMYNQNITLIRELGLPASEGHFLLKNKFGYSIFPYEIGRAPKEDIGSIWTTCVHQRSEIQTQITHKQALQTLTELIYGLLEHQRGGHFPAVDNPEAFVCDLRDFFGEHWSRA
ncbi:alpha/beta-hydrolase [Fomitiporia mediterranea MF3/22]|uniref:alpha/beta-hydrolase n=1 Tax=Fomitiporia mediterranea (strain MF3/22) TaxID=694068 RepID=UPI0004409376|nr:alpha/beta-hydrolase [Fomitiporia mediterranea MF3/22]EJD07878.1 alpha/beta-hydrolase [Fomitiporia mediterranea MF3/22]